MTSSASYSEESVPSTSRPPEYNRLTAVFTARKAADCCSYLLPYLSPTDQILDVGCGPGAITLDLARLVPQGRVVGLDNSSDHLGEARAAASAQGVTNVEFIEGDAHSIKALSEDGVFDVAHSHMVMMHLSNPVQALREMRRLVKPGGIVACRDVAALTRYPELEALENGVQVWHRISRARGAQHDAGKYLHVWAKEAGFAQERIEFGSLCWEFSGLPGRQMISEGAKNSIRDVALAGGYATEREMDEYRKAWEEWGQRWDARMMGLDGWILCRK